MQAIADAVMLWLPDADPGTVQAFAAILTLIATGWLALLTQQSVRASEKLVTHEERTELLRQRPCVVLEFYRPAPFEPGSFIAQNAGPGPALNAWIVDDPRREDFKVWPLGALMPHHTVTLPDRFQRRLEGQRDHIHAEPFFVVCEAVDGRGWRLSRNVLRDDDRIIHEHEPWTPTEEQKRRLHPRTVTEMMAVRYQDFDTQTDAG